MIEVQLVDDIGRPLPGVKLHLESLDLISRVDYDYSMNGNIQYMYVSIFGTPGKYAVEPKDYKKAIDHFRSQVQPMKTFKELQKRAHEISVSKGFHDTSFKDSEGTIDVNRTATSLALIHSEVSEALEELRRPEPALELYFNAEKPDKPEGFVTELADVVIRCMDTCEALGLDLEQAIVKKMKYNATRPHKHGNKKI